MRKLLIGCVLVVIASIAMAGYIKAENHQHTASNLDELGHGATLDSRGGHNCTRAAKRKDLCSGYHRHK